MYLGNLSKRNSYHLAGNSEEHTSLSRALTQLAEVEEKIEQLQSQQVPF